MRSLSVELRRDGTAWQSQGRGRRLAWVDHLRGAALLGMVIYHAAWDLHAYGLLDQNPSVARAWVLFGRLVAGLFFWLSGFGLALAQRQSTPWQAEIDRLIRLAGAAGAVSLVTWLVVPSAPVWFGMLHCLVTTNIIALILRPLPSPVLLVCAAVAAVAPIVFSAQPGVLWSWTGLTATEPRTLDFRPVLPWLAVVLTGLLIGRTGLANGGEQLPLRWLGLAGRHSLVIYLVHQPVMMGILMAIYGAMPEPTAGTMVLREPGQAAAFLRQCRAGCGIGGGEPDLCIATCHCALTAMLDQASPAPTPEAALKRCHPSP